MAAALAFLDQNTRGLVHRDDMIVFIENANFHYCIESADGP